MAIDSQDPAAWTCDISQRLDRAREQGRRSQGLAGLLDGGWKGDAVGLCPREPLPRGLPAVPTAAPVLTTPQGPLPHLNDLQHLHAGDLAVAIQVVHVEGPVQLLLKAAPGGDGQGTDELSKIDGAVPVLVEGSEGVLGELGGVSIREELQSKTPKVRCREGTNHRLPSQRPPLAGFLLTAQALPAARTRFGPALKAKCWPGEAICPGVLTPRPLALSCG